MQMVFKVLPACHIIANGIKSGSNSKKTDKHAADCRCMLGRKVVYVRCIIVHTTMYPRMSFSLKKKAIVV